MINPDKQTIKANIEKKLMLNNVGWPPTNKKSGYYNQNHP